MEDALKERADILEELLPIIFKSKSRPSEQLIKNIGIHKALGSNPSKIANVKSIKVNLNDIFEKYTGPDIIIEEKRSGGKCPISQCEIVNKWESVCGHVFEEKAVIKYIEKTSKCPVVGCKGYLKQRNV